MSRVHGGQPLRLWKSIGLESERSWSVPHRLAYALFLVPAVGAIVVILSRASNRCFRLLTGEDRIFEWTQFALYAVSAVLAFLVAIWLIRAGRGWIAALYLVFSVVAVFIAGEEIAWGQHLFDYELPEAIEEANEQAEATAHNIGPANDLFAGALALASLYGAVVPWTLWIRSHGASAGAVQRLLVPPLFLTCAFAIVFAYRAARWAVFQEDRFTVVKFQEWPELCFALALAVFAFLSLRLARQLAARAAH